jgi:hypothetical protein
VGKPGDAHDKSESTIDLEKYRAARSAREGSQS